jgi:hypothetical protein
LPDFKEIPGTQKKFEKNGKKLLIIYPGKSAVSKMQWAANYYSRLSMELHDIPGYDASISGVILKW